MLWTKLPVLIIISCAYGFGNAQGFNNSCNETEGGCTKFINCIGHYVDLETYIINNKTLVEKLSETFFTSRTAAFFTGRGSSQFVKITYNYHTSNVTNCYAQQSKYIWSEAVLFIFGPRPLYWLTLFAINIDEVDVTIELPCLCSDVYDDLLSRLTYLVCVYVYYYVHISKLNVTVYTSITL